MMGSLIYVCMKASKMCASLMGNRKRSDNRLVSLFSHISIKRFLCHWREKPALGDQKTNTSNVKKSNQLRLHALCHKQTCKIHPLCQYIASIRLEGTNVVNGAPSCHLSTAKGAIHPTKTDPRLPGEATISACYAVQASTGHANHWTNNFH